MKEEKNPSTKTTEFYSVGWGPGEVAKSCNYRFSEKRGALDWVSKKEEPGQFARSRLSSGR